MSGGEILSCAIMGRADAFAAESGVDPAILMRRAGEGAARAVMRRWSPRPVLALCGPGNNGGDGYVVARILQDAGWPVRLAAMEPAGGRTPEAARARKDWSGPVEDLARCAIGEAALIVDAMFGAGLSRPLEGAAARLAEEANASAAAIVALDAPSGVHGDRARAIGPAFRADLTVTFHRFKPAHVLYPGRGLCGEIALVDIGIPHGWRKAAGEPEARLNDPTGDDPSLLARAGDIHKHARGRLVVLAGGAGSTGAARIAAAAALCGGAGLATLLCPGSSLQEVAASVRSELTVKRDETLSLREQLEALRAKAAVLGPAGGIGERLAGQVLSAAAGSCPLVIDADALTSFEADPARLFNALEAPAILTPHEGEFARLFPDLAEAGQDGRMNKIERTRAAAERAGCVVLLKGPDTVIAEPGRTPAVNLHADPALATAGSGDALAGLIGAALAQGMAPFEAACLMSWVHGEAGRLMGPGATAETLLSRLPEALHALALRRRRRSALTRVQRSSP